MPGQASFRCAVNAFALAEPCHVPTKDGQDLSVLLEKAPSSFILLHRAARIKALRVACLFMVSFGVPHSYFLFPPKLSWSRLRFISKSKNVYAKAGRKGLDG
jgi:hypothetical protein